MKREIAIKAAMDAATVMQRAVLAGDLGSKADHAAMYWWQAENRVLPDKEHAQLLETVPGKLFDYCVSRDPNPDTLFSYSCQLQGADPAGREPDFGYAAFIQMVKLLAPLVEREAEPAPEVQPTGAPQPRQLRQRGRADKRISGPAANPPQAEKPASGKASKGSKKD